MTALVFDFGLKHIGVAMAEPQARLARRLTTLGARDGVPNWPALSAIVATWRPSTLVVGDPLNMDGTASEMSALAHAFGARLAQRYGLPVEYADERLSTFEALARGADAKATHAEAAEVIAETWLNSCTEPLPASRS